MNAVQAKCMEQGTGSERLGAERERKGSVLLLCSAPSSCNNDFHYHDNSIVYIYRGSGESIRFHTLLLIPTSVSL